MENLINTTLNLVRNLSNSVATFWAIISSLPDAYLIFGILFIWFLLFWSNRVRNFITQDLNFETKKCYINSYPEYNNTLGSDELEKYNISKVKNSIENEVIQKTEDIDTLNLLYDIDKKALAEIVVKLAFIEIIEVGDVYSPHFMRGINSNINQRMEDIISKIITLRYEAYNDRFYRSILLLARTDPEISTEYSHEHLISIKGGNKDTLVLKVALTEMRSFGFFRDMTGTMTIVFDIINRRFKIIMEHDDLVLLEKQLIIWENRIKESYEKKDKSYRIK